MDSQPSMPGEFPTTRLRRLRQHPKLRELARQTRLHPSQFIYPLFARSGKGIRQEIGSMPGVYQLSLDELEREVEEVAKLGIGGVLLFGIPEEKDPLGTDSYSDYGIIQQALRVVKRAAPELLAITDVCLCEYTDHGHCGVLDRSVGRTDVNNDATLELLAKQAVSHARAGADMLAPSGMMDGMVGAMRRALDATGFAHLPIMAYSAKYAGLDIAEGADIVMVKPALAYLDIVCRIRQAFPGVPLAAYNVSGEYSMVKVAAARGWIDERAVALDITTGIVRAGATIVITYWAKDLVRWLGE
ncbi:MAG: porphobilinogen synthase [Planctomycetia bacterium]|nr:porphobilinogen synthase [Planctomycetia bacterium]